MSIDYTARRQMISAAIEALLTGGHQSYTVDGDTVTKLDLATLQAEEQRLIALEKRQSRPRGAFGRVVPR